MSQQQQGEIIGGVVGGVIGSQIGDGRGQTAAIILGSIAGSMIGSQIGQNMDNDDRIRTAEVLNNGKTGQSASWVNPDTGFVYNVTPTRTYDRGTGPCREFQLDATVGNGERQDVFGTACLQADGSWMVM
ncbi:MAG: RT0821/Lpp0805 family surface protein [Woeseiaceae bacterium]|nr:RT0821/Lpp0805 family surface protein [Woeseiaceae bacterium]